MIGLFNRERGADPNSVFSKELLASSPHLNRVFVHQSDYSCLRLDAADEEPDRSHVLVVSDFLPEWKTADIREFLASDPAPYFSWVNDTLVLASFATEASATAVLSSCAGKAGAVVRAFAAYRSSLQDAQEPPEKRARVAQAVE